ncbi:peptidylprolyl isomerase [Clostridiaceae bacterium 35-E11]
MSLAKLKGKKNLAVLLILVTMFTVGCQTKAIDGNETDIVAKVNDTEISTVFYNKHLNLFKKNYEDMYGDKVWTLDVGGKTFLQAVQENVLEKLINDEVVIQYFAEKKVKVEDKEIEKQYAEYMERMNEQEDAKKFLEENGIDESFIKSQIKTDMYMMKFQEEVMKEVDVADGALKKYYDEHIDDYRDVQVKASHILVDTEKEAKDILAKIKAGEDFGELAKKHSKDPGSGSQGGDLGYFPRGVMVPEFEEVAFSMKNGEVSEPVKSSFGYHIIKVMDKKDEIKKFEEVKEMIKRDFMEKALMDKYDKIKENFDIKKFPENIQ